MRNFRVRRRRFLSVRRSEVDIFYRCANFRHTCSGNTRKFCWSNRALRVLRGLAEVLAPCGCEKSFQVEYFHAA